RIKYCISYEIEAAKIFYSESCGIGFAVETASLLLSPLRRPAMSTSTKFQTEEAEAASKNMASKEAPKGGKLRVYVHADTAFLQERLTGALGGEKDFEVIVKWEDEEGTRKSRHAADDSAKKTLVMFSTGMVLEDLHRIQGWKMTMPG